MPMINYPCDNCNSNSKEVYERYKAVSGMSVPLMINPFTKELTGKCQYWCLECIKKERESNE